MTQFDCIRQALKRSRRLASSYRRGGLQDLWDLTQDALTALNLLEKQYGTHQLGLWQESEIAQQPGGDNG